MLFFLFSFIFYTFFVILIFSWLHNRLGHAWFTFQGRHQPKFSHFGFVKTHKLCSRKYSLLTFQHPFQICKLRISRWLGTNSAKPSADTQLPYSHRYFICSHRGASQGIWFNIHSIHSSIEASTRDPSGTLLPRMYNHWNCSNLLHRLKHMEQRIDFIWI